MTSTPAETCQTCGLPDNCGDCTHTLGFRFNHTVSDGEVTSTITGYTVTYPARCNGHLGDLAFVVRPSGGSDFVHFSLRTGNAYGMDLPSQVSNRLRRMRAALLESTPNWETGLYGLDDCVYYDLDSADDCSGPRVANIVTTTGSYRVCEHHFNANPGQHQGRPTNPLIS